jgi:hypothetical protein
MYRNRSSCGLNRGGLSLNGADKGQNRANSGRNHANLSKNRPNSRFGARRTRACRAYLRRRNERFARAANAAAAAIPRRNLTATQFDRLT